MGLSPAMHCANSGWPAHASQYWRKHAAQMIVWVCLCLLCLYPSLATLSMSILFLLCIIIYGTTARHKHTTLQGMLALVWGGDQVGWSYLGSARIRRSIVNIIIIAIESIVMIAFKTDVQKYLPYNREKYQRYLRGEADIREWYAVSFQLPGTGNGRPIDTQEYFEAYESWFRNLILHIDSHALWVVNHDIDDWWFPNDEDTVVPLRKLFIDNGISNEFSGALIMASEDILKYSHSLISYPFEVFSGGTLYDDIDISHNKLPIVIKVSGHMNIDILSPDVHLLKEIVGKNRDKHFVLFQSEGTSIL